MASIMLRRAGPGDWAAIAALHSASWRSAYRGIYPDRYIDEEAPQERRSYWRRTLAQADAEADAVFLAEEEGVPIGFACIRRKAEAAVLDNLHVLPERKGEGIGTRLVGAAAAWLVEREPEASLQLGVWAANRAARAFYEHLGGVEVGEIVAPTAGGGSARQTRIKWERASDVASRSLIDRR